MYLCNKRMLQKPGWGYSRMLIRQTLFPKRFLFLLSIVCASAVHLHASAANLHAESVRKIYTFCCEASRDDEIYILYTLCFTTENTTECRINSKFSLEIQNKKWKRNLKGNFPVDSSVATVRVLIPMSTRMRWFS